MIIILFLVTGLIVDCLFCKIYSYLEYKKMNLREKEGNWQSYIFKLEQKDLIKIKRVRMIRTWCESVLRLNLFIVSYIPCHMLRNWFYKWICYMRIGKNVVIYYGAEIRSPWNIEIGEGTIIGDKGILDGRYGIKIGKNVNFSTGVWIWTLQHDVQSPDFGIKNQGKPVIVLDRAWISSRVVVLPGVVIGEGVVVGAGAVVCKDLDNYTICGGVPAKKIGDRNKELNYIFDGKHMFFL